MIYPGLEIGDYIIRDELGRGGFGSVFIADDKNTNKEVAIKFLHPNALKSSDSKQNFVDEMINQARLSTNPNIVHIIRSISYKDRQGEHLGMVMEYIDGDPMDIYIHKYGLLPDFIAIPIFLQILNGMSFAHEFNMLHRDIKPANIIVAKNGTVKIMDFGLAKVLSSYAAEESARAASLNYVSPERLQKRNIDRRTDIYSLGATFYEALTGRPLYNIEAGDWDGALKQHLSGRFDPIRKYYEGHNEFLESIISRSVDPDANRRYSDCNEFMNDLKKLWEQTKAPDSIKGEFKVVIDRTRDILSDGKNKQKDPGSNRTENRTTDIMNQFVSGGSRSKSSAGPFSNTNAGRIADNFSGGGVFAGPKAGSNINKVSDMKTGKPSGQNGAHLKPESDHSVDDSGLMLSPFNKFKEYIVKNGLKGQFMVVGISWVMIFILNLIFRETRTFGYYGSRYEYLYSSTFIAALVLSLPISFSFVIFFEKLKLKFWKTFLYNFVGNWAFILLFFELFGMHKIFPEIGLLNHFFFGTVQYLLIKDKFDKSFLWILSTGFSSLILSFVTVFLRAERIYFLSYLSFTFILFVLSQMFFSRIFMKNLYKGIEIKGV